MKTVLLILFLNLSLLFTFFNTNCVTWKNLETGLDFTEFAPNVKSGMDNEKICILKINPDYYKFILLTSGEYKGSPLTAVDWAIKHKQIAVINAGIYKEDFKTNVGFMKNYGYANNPSVTKDNAVIAFNPKTNSVIGSQILQITGTL